MQSRRVRAMRGLASQRRGAVMSDHAVKAAKAQAKALRASLEAQGTSVSHAQSLELVAHQHGARDWNTLSARLGNAPAELALNDAVRGQYLGQTFTGRIVSLARMGTQTQVAIQLTVPVDVVTSPHFSNLRHHIRAVIGPDGRSQQCTSDGVPHLVLDMP